MGDGITRRKFLATGLAAGAGLCALSYLGSRQQTLKPKEFCENDLKKGLVVVHGEDPRAMTRKAIEAIGGMDKLVKKGDIVVIKPNMAWADKGPEWATNTDPAVVAALVEMCKEAGAARVKVFDYTISENPRPAYEGSGIAQAARKAGADVFYVDKERFVPVDIPDGVALKSWTFYDEVVDAAKCNVLINAPAAKHHGTSKLSLGIKNVMGMIGGPRGNIHQDIHRKLADLNRVVMTDLTVLDAYRVLMKNGPQGLSLNDVSNSPSNARRIVVGTDRVAVDAYAADKIFRLKPEDVGFLRECQTAGLGEVDYAKNGLQDLSV
jgi:uncharacterized protein (DUF362 family)